MPPGGPREAPGDDSWPISGRLGDLLGLISCPFWGLWRLLGLQNGSKLKKTRFVLVLLLLLLIVYFLTLTDCDVTMFKCLSVPLTRFSEYVIV